MKDEKVIKSFWKHNWVWIIFILFWLIAFPYIMNQLLLCERFWNVVGGPVEWLSFWPSYLSAITSAVMIGFTAKTLKNNQCQLDELKRQWDEEHKPNVSVAFNKKERTSYLRIVNTSNVEVKDFKMKARFFVDEKTEKNDCFKLELLEQLKIDIEPQGIRTVVLTNNMNLGITTPKYFFLLNLYYNGEWQKEIKVYCSEFYYVGDIYSGIKS